MQKLYSENKTIIKYRGVSEEVTLPISERDMRFLHVSVLRYLEKVAIGCEISLEDYVDSKPVRIRVHFAQKENVATLDRLHTTFKTMTKGESEIQSAILEIPLSLSECVRYERIILEKKVEFERKPFSEPKFPPGLDSKGDPAAPAPKGFRAFPDEKERVAGHSLQPSSTFNKRN